ncbi:hypothetical protein Mgra_00009153 [Meloidogyne graminicola]|uniref:Uncharacterized protein n=1 Tax=Meloidogyne graminicola TaxID=189291 RepID=A0A8S9ZDP6_9BILA|nr:hypothetical protein Mgra_00009153 [Meloidogyne graminicola]
MFILFFYISFILFTQTEAIRGALFRTGRSTDEELIPQLINPYQLNNNCPPEIKDEEEEEEQFLNMASHPSLMVDLRKLLKFSRERALNEEIGNNLSQSSYPFNTKELQQQKQQNNNKNKYKSKRISKIRRESSPRLAAYIALFRNAHKNHPWTN